MANVQELNHQFPHFFTLVNHLPVLPGLKFYLFEPAWEYLLASILRWFPAARGLVFQEFPPAEQPRHESRNQKPPLILRKLALGIKHTIIKQIRVQSNIRAFNPHHTLHKLSWELTATVFTRQFVLYKYIGLTKIKNCFFIVIHSDCTYALIAAKLNWNNVYINYIVVTIFIWLVVYLPL